MEKSFLVLMVLRIVEVTVIYCPCSWQKWNPRAGRWCFFFSLIGCQRVSQRFGGLDLHTVVDVCSELSSGGNSDFLCLIFSLSSCCILCIVWIKDLRELKRCKVTCHSNQAHLWGERDVIPQIRGRVFIALFTCKRSQICKQSHSWG